MCTIEYHILLACNKLMFILVTSYYQTSHSERQQELDECLKRNIQNPYIERIYLLNDKHYDLRHVDPYGKAIQVEVTEENKKRLRFDYAIQWINQKLYGKRVILSNSDIYFDQTLLLLRNETFDRKAFALTRYDDNKLEMVCDSQDSWIFRSPLLIPLNECQFTFGTLGCDNRLAYVIDQAGYQLTNPCLTIRSHHLHRSNERTYEVATRLPPPYQMVYHISLL